MRPEQGATHAEGHGISLVCSNKGLEIRVIRRRHGLWPAATRSAGAGPEAEAARLVHGGADPSIVSRTFSHAPGLSPAAGLRGGGCGQPLTPVLPGCYVAGSAQEIWVLAALAGPDVAAKRPAATFAMRRDGAASHGGVDRGRQAGTCPGFARRATAEDWLAHGSDRVAGWRTAARTDDQRSSHVRSTRTRTEVMNSSLPALSGRYCRAAQYFQLLRRTVRRV